MKTSFILFLELIISVTVFAQPGSLDKTFGEQGKVLATTSTGLVGFANSVIIKKDGALLVGSGEGTSFLLKQFLNNGTPDSSFGVAGEAGTTFKKYLDAYTTAVSITGDNKIVAAGIGGGGAGTHNSDILLAKYLANGMADSGFGINGSIAVDFHLLEVINCMKITSQGKILVAGYGAANDEKNNNCFLAQFNSDGSVDTNFGDSGRVITDIDPAYQSYINSIAITPDGSIIAAGSYEYIRYFQQNRILVAKYDMNGKLETGFGTNGLVFTSVGTDADYAYAVALQNDEKIVVAGAANYLGQDSSAMAIVRYNSDGSIDNSFNNTGSLSIFFGSDNAFAKALVIQANGNFLLGGSKAPDHSSPPNYAAADFALASVTKDGKIDSLFGTNGLVTTDFAEGQDECDALALQTNGKIIAAGGSVDAVKQIGYIAISRYNGFQTTKHIIITKIKKWLQHHNGFTWENNSNVSSYVVQRSYDGIHWKALSKQRAVNNSSVLYYEDISPLGGANYYRLQTINTDGAVNYSNVLAISYQPSVISISPNPAKNNLHIEGLSSSNKTKLTVVDFSGKVAINQQLSTNNSSSYNLNIAALTPGNYLLKIEMNGEVVTKKFVKE